jgi:hypothetical protein
VSDRSTRQDLDHVLAVIAIDPGYNSYMDSGLAHEVGGWKENQRRIDSLMNELVVEAVRIAPQGMLSQQGDFPRHYYQIGPMSQGPYVELIELAQNAHAIIETVVTYLDLGTFAFQLREWWAQRTARPDYGRAEGDLVFTAPFIEGMCVADVIKRYGETRVRQVQSHSREEYFGSPSHPTGRERYTVTVSATRHRHYVYAVSGLGVISDHYLMKDGEVIPLDTPEWNGGFDSQLSRAPLRPHKAEITNR